MYGYGGNQLFWNFNDSKDHCKEMKCRIEEARAMFIQMKQFFMCRDLSITLKKRMTEC